MSAPIQRRTAPLPFTVPASVQAFKKPAAKQEQPTPAAAPAILPAAHVNIPAGLEARFALALQSQAMPWAESEAVILGLYAEDCEFRDPVMHFKDRAGFIKYLKFMDDWGKVPRVDITESHMEGKVGFAKGSLYYQPVKGPTMRADFNTRMEFNDAGRIVRHEDKWDVLGTLISTIMGRNKLPVDAPK